MYLFELAMSGVHQKQYNGNQTFKKLNGAILFTKLSKFAASPDQDMNDIMKRINLFDLTLVNELLQVIHDREKFLTKVNSINAHIKQNRKKYEISLISLKLNNEKCMHPIQAPSAIAIDWISLPKHLIPEMMSYGTYLAGKRKDWKGLANRISHGRRKRFQIESFIALLEIFCGPTVTPKRVLDLCGGRGDLSLVLAHRFSSWQITIMDRNTCALAQAEYRANKLSLTNVSTMEIDMFNIRPNHDVLLESYDIVLGLHACGSLTDIMLEIFSKPTTRFKHLFIATCCFGKVRECDRSEFTSYADADVGGNSEISRMAKLVINSRRVWQFKNRAKIIEMDERFFSFKNQLLYISDS